MKAKSVHICIFTKKPANAGGSYAPESLGSPETGMYNAVSAAGSGLALEGVEGTTFSMCYANSPNFQDFLKTVNATPPFIAIAGTFPDGGKKMYLLKSATPDTIKYIRAMWSGEFGGTGIPDNLGDGEGGWGQGNALICKIFPPLCALGFLPWLAIAAYSTYRAAEARSTVGRVAWGAPALLFWQGFFARGGVKQIEYWVKKI